MEVYFKIEEMLDICREAVRQVSEEDRILNMETELTAEGGIDSLAFMNIIIALEERFDIELDEELIKLKESKNIEDFVKQFQQILLNR